MATAPALPDHLRFVRARRRVSRCGQSTRTRPLAIGQPRSSADGGLAIHRPRPASPCNRHPASTSSRAHGALAQHLVPATLAHGARRDAIPRQHRRTSLSRRGEQRTARGTLASTRGSGRRSAHGDPQYQYALSARRSRALRGAPHRNPSRCTQRLLLRLLGERSERIGFAAGGGAHG